MAVAKMLKLRLVGVNAEQERLLNALHSTCAVELKRSDDLFEGSRNDLDKSEIIQKRESVEQALSLITKTALNLGIKEVCPDGFGVSYSEFMQIYQSESELLGVVSSVKDKREEILSLGAKIISLKTELSGYLPYSELNCNFSDFCDTQHARTRFGLASDNVFRKIAEGLANEPLATVVEQGRSSQGVMLAVVCHESAVGVVDKVLGESGFIKCPFKDDVKPGDKIQSIKEQIANNEQRISALNGEIANLSSYSRQLKLLADHYLFIMEKYSANGGFLKTESAFLLEAYVPAERREEVSQAITLATENVYFEFNEIKKDEYAPTLMRNKSVPRQFEFVTNLYSAPKYGELDPNGVLAFFFSVFLGFITADIGYGLLMTIGGFWFARRSKRETGTTKLAQVIAYGGIATILFGLAFDSFFGIAIIGKSLLPSPTDLKAQSVVAGISVPQLLLISIGMGAVHIMTGLFLTALKRFKEGNILDGIFDGIVWMLFLLGLILLVVGMVGVPTLTPIGTWLAVGSVVIGAITAGRHAKGFGKFTKGFGAVYGLINYMSDLLSYARLYGLLLSGAQIASIMSNDLALPMLKSPGGVFGVILCALIMFVGHAFNIAMGVLGAFIHDARLQYVEFFSRFYEGEGELFRPIGSKLEHVYLNDK